MPTIIRSDSLHTDKAWLSFVFHRYDVDITVVLLQHTLNRSYRATFRSNGVTFTEFTPKALSDVVKAYAEGTKRLTGKYP
jgi:hypothetical protein